VASSLSIGRASSCDLWGTGLLPVLPEPVAWQHEEADPLRPASPGKEGSDMTLQGYPLRHPPVRRLGGQHHSLPISPPTESGVDA
jgi:hypothetical protein